ncbi:MAG: hypothetical protein L6Q99_21565 [Planctomycetes bacterium]|nr:hypothetical protein [Planctomycetota bacterium]
MPIVKRLVVLVLAGLPKLAGLAGLASVLGACGGALPARPGTAPKHFLLVTVEGLRADHVSGAYLYLRPTTAWQLDTKLVEDGQALAIDDLCEQGVALAWAFTPSPEPRDALLGLHTGFPALVAEARPDAPTLAEVLAKAGFACSAFVSAGSLGDTSRLAKGFATFEARADDAETLDAALQALAALDRAKAERIFFWLHLDGPAAPFDPPAAAPREGESGGVVDFATRFVDPRYTGSIDGSLATLGKIERGELTLTPADRGRLVDLYDGEVAAVALGVRDFVAAWRNLDGSGGFLDDTLFVLAGTNGVDLYERPGATPRGGAWLGIERVRVPLCFRHPRSLTGSRLLSEAVDLTDVAPTVREWFLGLGTEDQRPPAGGRTLLPRFDSYVARPFESRPALSVDVAHRAAALRTSEWTLLSLTPAGSTTAELRLYDRTRDPREERDVAPTRPEKVAELHAELERRLAELKAP